MDSLIDETSAQIAARIRLERDARGWSLAELAERSGVSKATISKIERGEVSPTAVVLVRLAAAFDLTLAGLLVRAQGDGEIERVARAASQPVWRDPATGYVRTQVLSRPDHPVEVVQIEMPAGRQVVLPASSYAHIRQAVWLRDVEEFTYAEIAGMIDVPIGTVMSRISRGRRMLFDRLSKVRAGAA